MTGTHSAGTPGHGDPSGEPAGHQPSTDASGGVSGDAAGRADDGRRRRLVWRIGTPVVVLLSGALFVTSAIASDGTDLRPGRYSDLASVVRAEAQDYKALEQRRRAVTDEVDAVAGSVGSRRVHRIRSEVARLEEPAGLTPKSGPGVTITLSDAPTSVLQAARDANDPDLDLNRLVVHQQDIQAVVNALWAGGATAVTIAGQRIVSTTGIKCEGNAVQLQGVPYPSPYRIQAVGDPARLTDSIDSDPLVAGFRADAANPTIDVGWEMQTESDIHAPAYNGLVDLHYAKPMPSR